MVPNFRIPHFPKTGSCMNHPKFFLTSHKTLVEQPTGKEYLECCPAQGKHYIVASHNESTEILSILKGGAFGLHKTPLSDSSLCRGQHVFSGMPDSWLFCPRPFSSHSASEQGSLERQVHLWAFICIPRIILLSFLHHSVYYHNLGAITRNFRPSFPKASHPSTSISS